MYLDYSSQQTESHQIGQWWCQIAPQKTTSEFLFWHPCTILTVRKSGPWSSQGNTLAARSCVHFNSLYRLRNISLFYTILSCLSNKRVYKSPVALTYFWPMRIQEDRRRILEHMYRISFGYVKHWDIGCKMGLKKERYSCSLLAVCFLELQ